MQTYNRNSYQKIIPTRLLQNPQSDQQTTHHEQTRPRSQRPQDNQQGRPFVDVQV